MTTNNAQTVLVIGGPTASGKSGLALSIAREKGGCVINADSVQLYDGLGTLTAQPSLDDRHLAPHRLYACLKPHESCTAAQWRAMALKEIAFAKDAGLLPIVVGGTGFYIKTLLEGLSPVPHVPQSVRAEMIARQRAIGNPAFHAELTKLDPETAAKLDPYNTQRVVRAREVFESTGKGLAYWQSLPRAPAPAHLRFVTVTLIPPRDILYAQCNKRFLQMLEMGALDEVRAFNEMAARDSLPKTAPLLKALGYAELTAHLQGALPLEDAAEKASAVTRQYAKRQTTWFRNQLKARIALETAAAYRDVLLTL